MSWRDCSDAEYCDAEVFQLLYRDDGVVLGLVLRLRGGENTDASDKPMSESEWIAERAKTIDVTPTKDEEPTE